MARVDGSETLALSRERVWELLNDPETLGDAIPGCRGLERDGDAEHRYRTSIAVAVGAVKGVYDGTVTYADIAEPERCTIKVSGRGDKGTIDGQGEIELRSAEAGTEVAYRGEFKLTGPVAGVGQRLAPGVSRKMIVETLRNLESSGAAPGPRGDDSAPAPGPDGGDRPPALRSSAARHRPTPAPGNAAGGPSPASGDEAGGGSATPAPGSGAGGGFSGSAREVEPFNPVPDWVRPAGLVALGLVIGFVLGRII
jgi:carbon monoxide dehydrogenase subunit G